MASSSKVEHFHNASDCALERLGKSELSLKEAQFEALRNIVYNLKDTIRILPTGFRKSLIYQMKCCRMYLITFIPNEMKPFFNSQSNMAFLDLTRVSHSRSPVKGTMTLGTRVFFVLFNNSSVTDSKQY